MVAEAHGRGQSHERHFFQFRRHCRRVRRVQGNRLLLLLLFKFRVFELRLVFSGSGYSGPW